MLVAKKKFGFWVGTLVVFIALLQYQNAIELDENVCFNRIRIEEFKLPADIFEDVLRLRAKNASPVRNHVKNGITDVFVKT